MESLHRRAPRTPGRRWAARCVLAGTTALLVATGPTTVLAQPTTTPVAPATTTQSAPATTTQSDSAPASTPDRAPAATPATAAPEAGADPCAAPTTPAAPTTTTPTTTTSATAPPCETTPPAVPAPAAVPTAESAPTHGRETARPETAPAPTPAQAPAVPPAETVAPLPAELRPAPPAADQPVPPDDPARSSKTAEPDPDWHPTENPKSTLVPGQMRSDREEVPAPFTKEDADKAEIAEAGLRSSRSLTASSCQVYWPSWFQVCGAIRDKYNSLGGPASFLSYPTSGNIVNPGGTGERVTFANGPIYWSAATGAHPVVNSFLNRWGIHGYEAGWLKYPTTDEVVLPDGGRRQEFQEGAIYVAFQNAIGSAIRNGPLRDKYNSVGGLAPGGTLLGYPIQDQIGLPDGQGQMDRFERGVIYWHPAHGAHPISGPLLTQWERAGYEQGTYGYPISDQVSHPNIAVEQQFQNGRIYSPGLQLPLGTTGLSLYFGVPSAAPLQPAALSNGIVLHGDGLDVKFRPMESNAVEIGLDITTAQASSTFKLALALPSGYTLQSGSGRVNLLSPTGVVLGAVGHPIAVDAGGQLVNVQVSASGAEITYQFAPFTAFPIQSVSDSVTEAPGKIADQVQRWWGTGIQQRQVCEANPVDCMRAKPYVDVSIKQAKEAFPERNGEEDNRTDAARHCMWMGYSTERANADFARQMGTAHELDVPGSEEAGMMDRYNNKTGIDVGLRNEDNPDGIHTTCVQYAREARIVPDPRTIDLSNPNTNDLIALRHP